MEREMLAAAEAAFATEADCLSRGFSRVDPQAFLKAADILCSVPRIAAAGCGHTGIACRHFAHLMCCADRPARFLSPSEATHGEMGFLQRGDALVLASRGGKTKELLPILAFAKKRGVSVIAVTENADSPIAREADAVLLMYVTRETDPDNTQGTTSFAEMNCLFDALQAAVIAKTGWRAADFADVHPGGAVGERLGAKP